MARSLLLGTALGVGTRLVYHGPDELLWLHKLGAPWLGAAFLIGMLRSTPSSGAMHGAIALATAVLAYYAMPAVVADDPYAYSRIGVGWLWVAVPGGALFGAAGAAWRTRPAWRLPATVLVVGSLLGEGLTWHLREKAHPALFELCLAAAFLAVLLDGHRQRLLGAAMASTAAAAGAVAVVGVYFSLGYLVG